MKNCIFKQSKDIIFRQEENEAILFNPESSDIVVINSTGCYIWGFLNGNHTKEDILEKIQEKFVVTKGPAEKDLDKFISDLKTLNFIASVK